MNKININGKNVIVLCSGPSVSKVKKINNDDIVIIPNRSILLSQIKYCDNILWIKGTGWQREKVTNWWMELANSAECKPKEIFLRNATGSESRYNITKNKFLEIFKESKVLPLNVKANYMISTGMCCIAYALENNAKSIEVHGMELGIDSRYDQSIIDNEANQRANLTHGGSIDNSFTRHLREDIFYLKSLKESDVNKIIPSEYSGLKIILEKLKRI